MKCSVTASILAAFSELKGLEFCWTKHDACDSIEPNETKFGLTNDEEQSYWHCNCDLEFYHCLHRINSTVSNHVGDLHFNFYTRCYRRDRQIQDCNEYDSRDSSQRCIQYILDLNTHIENQWFDLPYYSGKPMKNVMFVV